MGEFGRVPPKGYIRMALINAAIDEDLARSVFRTISNARPVTCDSIPLERLKLRPARGIYTSEACEKVEYVSKWWLLQRHPRDDPRNDIVATPLRYPGDLDAEKFGPPAEFDFRDKINFQQNYGHGHPELPETIQWTRKACRLLHDLIASLITSKQ